MITEPTSFNPFEPPADSSFEIAVSNGRFAVDGGRLLCHDRIKLPPVCIATGEESELRHYEQTLRTFSTGSCLALILAAVVSVCLSYTALGLNEASPAIQITYYAGLTIVLGTAFWKSKFGQIEVHASYFVSTRCIHKRRLFCIAFLVLVLILICGIWMNFDVGTNRRGSISLVLALTSVGLQSIFMTRPRLEIIRTRNGLAVISGASAKFLQNIAASRSSKPERSV